jgi:hypothetical protein
LVNVLLAADPTAAQTSEELAPAAGSAWLVMSGLPSTLRVSTIMPWSSPDPPCATFRVRTVAPKALINLTTTGLGATLLTDEMPNRPVCSTVQVLRGSHQAPAWTDRLVLEGGTGPPKIIDRLVAVRVDIDSLRADGVLMDGRILALAPGERTLEIPLKIERTPASPFFTAAAWFLGVFIPAAIAAGFGFLVAQYNAAETAQSAFRTYVAENPQVIAGFVDNQVKSTLLAPGVQGALKFLLGEMYRKNMLAKLPKPQSERLRQICFAEDRQQYLTLLTELFPELTSEINAIRGQLPP